MQITPRWFRRLVLPAYHDSWAAAETEFMGDPLQRRRIEELQAELTRDGFQQPVTLARENRWSPRPTVADGLHRSVAAMRLGIPIPVRFGYDDATHYDHSDVYRVSANAPVPEQFEDLTTAVLALASFRCTAGPWIQCDIASGPLAGPVELYLPRHPELRGQIAAELQDRLQVSGVDAVVEFKENRATS